MKKRPEKTNGSRNLYTKKPLKRWRTIVCLMSVSNPPRDTSWCTRWLTRTLGIPVEDSCTLDEALAFRKRLHAVGEDQFITETVEAETITAKKLCTAFSIRPPQFLEDAPDTAYYPLLGLGISRELSKRLKLSQYNTVDDAVDLLNKSKNIIVLTGAGVSVSSQHARKSC